MPTLQQLLGLRRPPIAIGFLQTIPEGVERWSGGPVPAGCFFWKQAQEGRTFYTLPSDHYNCAVGAHTHHIPLPEERSAELEQTVGFMVTNNYIAMEEVPGIPTLAEIPAYIAYGPAETPPFSPSVFLIAADPAQVMLLYEACLKAGASSAPPSTLGRPGCAVLPLSLQSEAAAFSLGCKGNRTFTGLPNTEMYLSIPAAYWAAVIAQAEQVIQANQTMASYYQAKS